MTPPADPPERELGSVPIYLLVPTIITIRSRPRMATAGDSDLLCGLSHSDGNTMIETVLRHEATGQSPGNLIHRMSVGAVVGDDTSDGAGHRRTLSENSPLALRSNQGSISATATTVSSTPRTMPDRQRDHSHTANSHAYVVSPSLVHGTLSRFLALDMTQTQNLFKNAQDATVLKVKTRKHQKERLPLPSREMDMLSVQAGIEASLKEARNSHLDDEALSYAVQASKKSFEEESKQVELRNALEVKITRMALADSLSYPVKKSEEELIAKAMIESLADPVKKSEDQLIQEAMRNSLKDPIRNFEEELVEEVMRLSLLPTVSREEEELFEAAKHQSLISFAESGGKMPAQQASIPNSRRIPTENASSSWYLPEDILDYIDDKKRPSTSTPDFCQN